MHRVRAFLLRVLHFSSAPDGIVDITQHNAHTLILRAYRVTRSHTFCRYSPFSEFCVCSLFFVIWFTYVRFRFVASKTISKRERSAHSATCFILNFPMSCTFSLSIVYDLARVDGRLYWILLGLLWALCWICSIFCVNIYLHAFLNHKFTSDSPQWCLEFRLFLVFILNFSV